MTRKERKETMELKDYVKMKLKDYVTSLKGNPIVDITVWHDDYSYTIIRMRKDNVLKSPKFNQYADFEVTWANDGKDHVIYLDV